MKHLNYLRKLYLLPVLLILVGAIPALAQPMSGIYTVGGGTPNYLNIKDAVADVVAKGVSGPVTFDIRNGSYTDQVIVPDIPGASAANRITIKSESGNAQACVYTVNAGSTNNFIFRITGSYITVKNLKLVMQNATYSSAIWLTSNASYDSVSSCVLEAPVVATTGTTASLVFAQYLYGTNNVLHNDSMKNGSMGVYAAGLSTGARVPNFIMDGCTVLNPYYMGVQFAYTENLKVRNNTILQTTPYTSPYGLYSVYGYNACDYLNNTVTVNTPSGGYGIAIQYNYGDQANAALRAKVAGNTLNMNATAAAGTCYPIYFYEDDYMTAENNTFNATSTTGTSFTSYLYYSSYLTFNKNTINTTTTTGTVYGVAPVFTTGKWYGSISNNKITTTTTTGTNYGLYPQSVNRMDIYNNEIIVNSTTGTTYGLYCTGTNLTNVINNSVHSNSATTGTNYAAYFNNTSTSATGNTVYNNVFSKTTGSTSYGVIYNYSQLYTATDYNNVYAPTGNLFQRGTPALNTASLQTWRTTVGSDRNSLSYDPGYTSTTSLVPNPANASSWSLNGRGVHISTNTTDKNGNPRVTTKAAGVPDIGAYEFTPTATPPTAIATPAAPASNTTQVFTFGQDTVATLVWPVAGAVPASITVRQYTGTLPPTINTLSPTSMYFYTDISIPSGTYTHNANIYYQDPWGGTTASEAGLRMAKKDGANPWVGYDAPASTTDANRNIITAANLNTFGFYTGVDNSLNAGVSSVVSPSGTFCAGTLPVQVRVNNYSVNPINTVTIKWSINGVAQPDVPYATTIPAFGNATVTLGNVAFSPTAQVIRAWTVLPNATTDPVINDDSTTVTLRSAMSGVYTIGGTTPNYTTLALAVADLNTLGVCGPVTFNIRTGTYTATQATVNRVKGGSAVNTVTFQSETGVAANVTLSFTGTSAANNYMLKLDSASNVIIKNLTFRNTATATYAGAIWLNGDASSDSIVNCVFTTPIPLTTINTSSSGAFIFASPLLGANHVVKGNTFTGGAFGLYWWGLSTSIRTNNNIFDNNTFTGQTYMAIYHYYGNNVKIRNNTFTSSGALSSGYYGINNYYANGAVEIAGNTMTLATTSTGGMYGLYNAYNIGDAATPSLHGRVYSNNITITSNTSTAMYGMYVTYSNYDSVRGNTVNLTTAGTGSVYPFYTNYAANSYVRNNTFNGTSPSYYAYMYCLNYSPNSQFISNNITLVGGGTGYVVNYAMQYSNGSTYYGNTINETLNYTSGYIYNYINYSSGRFGKNIITTNGSCAYQYALYVNYVSDMNIDSNTITSTNTYTTGYVYGIYSTQASNSLANTNMRIAYNKFDLKSVYYMYGLNINYPSLAMIEGNNLNCYVNGTGTCYLYSGFYWYSPLDCIGRNNVFHLRSNYYVYYPTMFYYPYGSKTYWYNNTVNVNANNGGNYNYWYNSSPGTYTGTMYSYNNVYNFTGPFTSYMNYMYEPNMFKFDYNMWNGPQPTLFQVVSPSMGYPMGNLQNWRNATGNDKNSLVYAPVFVNGTGNVGDLHPLATNSASWAMNGRGIHMPGNTRDADGNPRPTNRTQGAPDLGAYEHTPALATLPPLCNMIGAATPGTTQIYLLGQDTVASVKWGATSVPATNLAVRQYSGAWPPSFLNPFMMNIYTDIQPTPATGTYDHDVTFYYKDPQLGLTAGEGGLRLVKKDGTNPWIPFSSPQSVTDPNLNKIVTTALTDFGYHTGSDVSDNAGATGVSSPIAVFCSPSTQTIKLTIKNLGNNVINNVQIGYQYNNGPIATINYNTPIQTALNPAGNSATITLPNYNFTTTSPNNVLILKAWTSLPNGNVDPVAGDDTLNTKIWPGLNGVYTVGGTTPDFVDVKEAVDVMMTWGVCGPVTFNIRDGVYANNSYLLSNIPRVNATDRIRFQSESGNASGVTISTTGAYLFNMNNASYITLKNLTLTTSNAATYHVVELQGNSQYDSVVGCVLNAPTTTSTTNTFAPVFNIFPAHNNTYAGNTINGGTCSFYIYGSSNTATTWLSNIVVDGNTLNNAYYYGLGYIWYTGGLKINNNTMNFSGTGYYGAYIYYPYNFEMNGNRINDTRTGGGTGLALYYANTTVTTKNIIANNVYAQTVPAHSSYGLLAIWYATNTRILNNSVLQLSTYNTVNYGPGLLYISGYSGNEVYNNAFINKGGGPGMVSNDVAATNPFDYNNVYSTGTNTFSNYSTYTANMPAWRTATGKDKNSLSYDPGFVSNTDLHPDASNPNSWSLNGRGIHLSGNNKDKDGNPRVTLRADGVPDIGAYEFVPGTTPPNAVATPATSTAGVPQVFTFGYDTVAVINWAPNSVVPTSVSVRQYTGTVGPNHPSTAFQYFYTDINVANITYNASVDMYYKDPWLGTIGTEANLRMLKRLSPNPWVAYNGSSSSADVARNYIRANTLTSLGWFTGIEDGTIFSAIITPASSTVFCPGGSVVLQANTGAGYTYQWSLNNVPIPGATNANYTATSAGDYTVAVTNSSNVTAIAVSVAVTIVSPPSAVVTANGPLTFCTGNGLTLMANTGIGLTYQWQFNGNNIVGGTGTSIPVTGAGTYTVTVKNIGCATTSSPIPVGSGPITVDLGLDTSYCEAGPLVLDAGYPGAKYTWSTQDTSQQITIYNQSGKYWVYVDAGPNCQGTDTIKVDVSPLPSVIGISYLQNGSMFTFSPSGQQNVKSYLWIYSDGAKDTAKNSSHTFSTSGQGVMLVVFNDCGTDTTYLSNLSVGGVTKGELEFRLYPNPAQTEVTLSVSGGTKFSEVTIINAVGQVVYRGDSELVESMTLDVSKYANGHYIMRANSAGGVTISKPFDVLR